jgi:hypothetical protein
MGQKISLTKAGKYCATCRYWTGPREYTSLAFHLTVDNSSQGTCVNRNARWQLSTNAMAACGNPWEVWEPLNR